MFLSLFNSKHGFVVTDQRVFAADELQPLLTVVDQAKKLDERLARQVISEEETKRHAQQQGYEDGLASGKKAAAMQLTESMKSLHDEHDKAVLDLQSGAADLAVNIVRKIADQVESAEWLMAQAQCAAEDLTEQSAMKLRVHPSQADAVKGQLANYPHSRVTQVVADDFLPLDGCALETVSGQINVDLETQLNNVLALLRDDVGELSTVVDAAATKDLND